MRVRGTVVLLLVSLVAAATVGGERPTDARDGSGQAAAPPTVVQRILRDASEDGAAIEALQGRSPAISEDPSYVREYLRRASGATGQVASGTREQADEGAAQARPTRAIGGGPPSGTGAAGEGAAGEQGSPLALGAGGPTAPHGASAARRTSAAGVATRAGMIPPPHLPSPSAGIR